VAKISTPAVEFVNVSKIYESSYAVNNLNLAIPKGKIVTIIGPSGCGKSTTLKMINRIIDPSKGTLLVEGQDVRKADPVNLRKNIGYVIQQIGLFPHMTIEDNISLVLRLKGSKKEDMERRAKELLHLIGLEPDLYRHRYPHELSGGQQQRIGVARALCADPSIILMDEPFSALDPISRLQLQDELINLQEKVKKTIIFVTHDMDEALKVSDQIILLRDGELVQSGTPAELLRQPKNEFVREFIGEKRFQQSFTLQTARDVMTSPITVLPTQELSEAVHLMRRHSTDGVVAINNDSVYLGVVSAQEIYEHYEQGKTYIEHVMCSDVPEVSEETPITTVFLMMKKSCRDVLPVLNDKHQPIGVVTRANVIHAMALLFDREEIAG
jgi:osmoprotectant transport system ATP-binding protein